MSTQAMMRREGLVSMLSRWIRLARLGGGPLSAGTPALRVEQVLPLDPRRRLVVVRLGPQRLLLLTGGPQDLSLGWLPPAPDAAA